MAKNDGGPVFPLLNYTSEIGPDGAGFMAKDSNGKSVWVNSGCPGMSLRDWFAGMALQGMLSGVESDYMAMQATLNDCERRGLTIQGYFAARASTAADAMLKRRVADD